jgi:excisionase family DNA binding protein
VSRGGRDLARELAAALREDSELRAELVAALDLAGREAPPSRQLTVEAVAASRSIGKSTVRRAIREHRLEVVRVGRAVRVPADAVIAAPARTTTDAAMQRAERQLGLPASPCVSEPRRHKTNRERP